MIRIAITQAAFEAIVGTMPFGNVGYEPERGSQGRYPSGLRERRRPSSGRCAGPAKA